MATLQQIAAARQRQRQALGRRVAEEVAALWRALNIADLDGSWNTVADRVFALVAGAQALAAAGADRYVADALDAQGIDPAADGQVDARSLAGVASDGRPLDTLLAEPLIAVKTLIGRGTPVPRAMSSGLLHLDLITRTQITDAGRVADGVALAAHRRANGYVRMLNPPSCSRCVILAGRWYRYNHGFQRHPRCDCVHVPANEDDDDLRTDPRAYFDSLSVIEQDKVFTKAGAESIRLGADMSQIVNARRSAIGLTPAGARITEEEAQALRGGRDRGRLQAVDVYGRQHFVTTEGMTRRGFANQRLRKDVGEKRASRTPRLMPESILEIAESREDAIRLLTRFGYIL